MAEDRPDRHPEPDPPAAAGSTPAGSHPSEGTAGGRAPDSDTTSPNDTEKVSGGTSAAADRTTAVADHTARMDSGSAEPADGTAKLADGATTGDGGVAALDEDDAPTEVPRPAPWRGAAAVPPPGPKKRRRFGFGRDRDEEQPAPRPEKPVDPTLDLPAPVDPWEGTEGWDDHAPDHHYDHPAPPLHPTRIDRADLPRTTVEPPSRRSAAPPPPPPQQAGPQSPPHRTTPQEGQGQRGQQPRPPHWQPPHGQQPPYGQQPPRSEQAARSQQPPPPPPPQYAPPSYPRSQQPPPPPPAQTRPAQSRPPGPPAAPPKEKKRKKDRRAAATRPQLPPGYPPPGYPPPQQMRRRRRRKWPMVLLTMLLLTVACCCGLPAYFGVPLWQQYPASASLPDAIADLSLSTGPEADETSQALEGEMRGVHLLAESTFAGVYGDAAGKQVTVFGVTGFRWSPESDLEAEMTRLTEIYALSGVEPVDAGDSGGFQRCGTGEADGATVVVCGWADHGSLGTAVFTRRSVADSAALLDRIRGAVITRDQISFQQA